MGTESHLDNSYFNSELFPCNYNVYRKDRNKHGGGIFILVNNTIPPFQIEVDSPLELIWEYLHVNTQADIIFGCFYCPPHSTISELHHLHVSLSAIKSKYPAAKIFLGGDFNCPGIDWSNNSLTDSYIPSSFREYLITFAADFYLNQIVNTPTRGSNVLDLCFVTHPKLFTSVKLYQD